MRKLTNEELGRLDVEGYRKAVKTPLVIVLDNVRSLNNIGSVFRTADAFRIRKIYLCGITATPPHKDIRKTALGATETVDWEYSKNTLATVSDLQAQGMQVIALEQADQAIPLSDFQPLADTSYALIFGNEVKGVMEEVVQACNTVVEIPQFGTKHSLNIAVSVGVTIWDFWNKIPRAF
ncbi:MAG: RNA methyltransferase [Bacteroidota bacterium]